MIFFSLEFLCCQLWLLLRTVQSIFARQMKYSGDWLLNFLYNFRWISCHTNYLCSCKLLKKVRKRWELGTNPPYCLSDDQFPSFHTYQLII